MNNRGLLKYIFICIATFISFYFIITSEVGFGPEPLLPIIFLLFLSLTIFMYFNKNKIHKNKFIYDVILLLLMIFFIALVIYIISCDIICYLSDNCGINVETNMVMIYSVILFSLILFYFTDIFNKTNKTNDIMTISISIIIILIHLRYYLDPNFMHRIDSGDKYILYSYTYITQNYAYFITMYIVSLLHRKINKQVRE